MPRDGLLRRHVLRIGSGIDIKLGDFIRDGGRDLRRSRGEIDGDEMRVQHLHRDEMTAEVVCLRVTAAQFRILLHRRQHPHEMRLRSQTRNMRVHGAFVEPTRIVGVVSH